MLIPKASTHFCLLCNWQQTVMLISKNAFSHCRGTCLGKRAATRIEAIAVRLANQSPNNRTRAITAQRF